MEGESQVKGILNKGFFNKDVTLRIISVLIAIILWLYVVDIQNPENEVTLKDVPIEFTHTDSLKEFGLFILNENKPKVNLKVKGRRKTLAGLDTNNIKATVDLTGFNRTGEHSIPVQVDLPIDGITILEKKPYHVVVKLDKMMEIQKPITVIPKGTVKDPYIALQPQIMPNIVTLRGPSSIISTIDSLRVSVDLSGQTKDIITTQKYEIYNKNGEKINSDNISREVDTVQIVYPIIKSKEVTVIPKFVGLINENYVVEKTEINPATVKVAGKSEVVDDISQVFTEPINIANIEKDLEVDVPIQIPKELKLIDVVNSVNVKLDVEKRISRTLTLKNIRVNNVPEDLSYRLITKQLEVTLKGIEDNVNALKSSDIYASIDIKDLNDGEHKVPVNIQVFSDVEVVGNYVVDIKLSRQRGEGDTQPVNSNVNNQKANSSTDDSKR
jgi:YbbR domain-containing protein